MSSTISDYKILVEFDRSKIYQTINNLYLNNSFIYKKLIGNEALQIKGVKVNAIEYERCYSYETFILTDNSWYTGEINGIAYLLIRKSAFFLVCGYYSGTYNSCELSKSSDLSINYPNGENWIHKDATTLAKPLKSCYLNGKILMSMDLNNPMTWDGESYSFSDLDFQQTSGEASPAGGQRSLIGICIGKDSMYAVGKDYNAEEPQIHRRIIMRSELDPIYWEYVYTDEIAYMGVGQISICYSFELDLYVSVGYNCILTSSDGENWALQTVPEANTWEDVCWSPDLLLFIAVSSDGTYRVMTSPDGEIWTLRNASGVWPWVGICSGNNTLIANTRGGNAMRSVDGINWTTITFTHNPGFMSFGNNVFVGGCTGYIMTSPDGITWTEYVRSSFVAQNNYGISVLYNNWLLNDEITIEYTQGFSVNSKFTNYFNDLEYKVRVSDILNIKKQKDQFYYGILKFQSGNIEFINNDGYFDDWSQQELYNNPIRILIGEDTDYSNYEKIFTGVIGNTKRKWDIISVNVEDVRKNLTVSIANNLLNQTDWPDLSNDDVDKPKPIAYGDIFNAHCICLNTDEGGSYYTFLMCDTEFNAVSNLVTVRVDGVVKAVYSSDLAAGTFVLTSANVGDNQDSVTADFTVNIKNGVSIIKDLILNYDNKPYIADFWDLTETTLALTLARNTSVYVDGNKKLHDVIKDVASDIQGLFFAHDDGTYTIRIFDENRTPVKIIYKDEWMDDPVMDDNSDEFLTSCIVEYRHDQDKNEYRQYENKTYEDATFQIYKKYNNETFKTNLTSLSNAQAFSEDILKYRTAVPITVTRSVKFQHYNLEIMDFLICDPLTRISEAPVWGIWEIIGIVKNIDKMEIELTLRYIKSYTFTEYEYSYIWDDSIENIWDEDLDPIIYWEVV